MRVIGVDGAQLGVLSLGEAINRARALGVDLVEVASQATPPVCRLVDYGKYRYEQAKKEKEARKHHHAHKVKEVQLSANIDPHDFGVKLEHAIDFLCEEMKVKVTLRFRGRENIHKEFGFQQVNKFIKDIAPYGHPDSAPRLIGRGVNVMISPLPRNKRARHPKEDEREKARGNKAESASDPGRSFQKNGADRVPTNAAEEPNSGFGNNPFAQLEKKS